MHKALLFITGIILMSCTSKSIPMEKQREMEALLKQSVTLTLMKETSVPFMQDLHIELRNLREEEYKDSYGDYYGTYVGNFHYSFRNGPDNVKVSGIIVFSYDGDISIVRGEPGIIIDMIAVNGDFVKDIKSSKYYITNFEI